MLNLIGLVSGFCRSIGLGRMWVLGLSWGVWVDMRQNFCGITSLDNFPWLGVMRLFGFDCLFWFVFVLNLIIWFKVWCLDVLDVLWFGLLCLGCCKVCWDLVVFAFS